MNKMKERKEIKNKHTQKGITLIALIITIVVLLILAVVAIAAIRNDGIIVHAQNTTNIYNQSVENEQGMLGSYEDFLNDAMLESVEPKVGQYVKYNVSYTDMYGSSKTFGETDGWRYLGKDGNNHLIISTGIPMKLYYDEEPAGESAKWWDTTQINRNAKAAQGMLNNFDKIPFAQKASGSFISSGETNTAIGAFAPSKRTYNGVEYDAVGDYFKVQNQKYSSKILKVRTLTLAELNRATNSARAGESGYTQRAETSTEAGFKDIPEGNLARGLFDLTHISGLSSCRMFYLLATPLNSMEYGMWFVDYYGRSLSLSNYTWSGDRGVRPVVVLSSEIQFTDANGDGVLEIN